MRRKQEQLMVTAAQSRTMCNLGVSVQGVPNPVHPDRRAWDSPSGKRTIPHHVLPIWMSHAPPTLTASTG